MIRYDKLDKIVTQTRKKIKITLKNNHNTIPKKTSIKTKYKDRDNTIPKNNIKTEINKKKEFNK